MTYQNTLGPTIRPARANTNLVRIGRSLVRAIRRRRAERLKRNTARELERTLRSYPDYLLKDIGYVRSGPPLHGNRLRNRF